MEAKTVLRKIEVELATNKVFVVFDKKIVNGDIVLASEPHRVVLNETGADNDTMMSQTDAILISLGYPAISSTDRALISAYAKVPAV